MTGPQCSLLYRHRMYRSGSRKRALPLAAIARCRKPTSTLIFSGAAFYAGCQVTKFLRLPPATRTAAVPLARRAEAGKKFSTRQRNPARKIQT